MEIMIKKERENAVIPAYGSRGAAGADLHACTAEPTELSPGETVLVPFGVSVAIPDGYAGLVFARSGLSSKRGVAPANKVGVIDSDYRGELKIYLHNHSSETAVITPGERVAQLVIVPVAQAVFTESDELPETARGAGGFGSTGRW